MPEDIRIVQTTDPLIFGKGAELMAASDPWITLGLDRTECYKSFEGACKEIYVAWSGSEIAGFAIIQVCGSFKGYIQTLFVDRAFQGKGAGTQLLWFCENRIQKISPNIFICVSTFNTGAKKLYERFGFQPVGELHDFVRPGYSELLLRKTSGPLAGFMPSE